MFYNSIINKQKYVHALFFQLVIEMNIVYKRYLCTEKLIDKWSFITNLLF